MTKYILILLLIGCTKSSIEIDTGSKFNVIAVTNENNVADSTQYQLDTLYITSNSVEWRTLKESDVFRFVVTFQGDSIGNVMAKGMGQNNYSYIYLRRL